jgi:DNA repair exonuclease SbcCD ATPase subunit
MTDVQSLRNKLEQRKGQRMQIERTIDQLQEELKLKTKDLQRHEKAREIIKEVGLKTQQALSFHISNITSMALSSVFDNPYELSVEFVQRRNKTECDLWFVRDGNKMEPREASGGGAVDVASFALRIASWSMQEPHTRPILILDEPFKHLKGEDANLRMLDMINEISKKLGIQIIMISDERVSREDIEEKADKIFEVTMNRKGISKLV